MHYILNESETANKLIYMDNVQSAFRATIEHASKKQKHSFAVEFQILVTKVALIADALLLFPKKDTPGTYLGGISYLCLKVLNNKELFLSLRKIHANERANKQKHKLENIDIDIESCVNAYNRMINALSLALCCPNLQKLSINGLQQANVAGNYATLNDQDVTRKINSFQNVSKQGINNKKMTDKKNGYTQKSMATSSFIARDGNRSLKVSIISGDGVISKKSLFFQEKKYVDFSIEIEYSGAEKLKSLKAEIPKLQGGKKTFTVKEGVNKFQLEAKEYCFPNIRITVTALIKLGLFTTKELKCTVSKNFAWVNRKVE